MAPKSDPVDASATPEPNRSIATLPMLRVGVKVFAEKDGGKRKAEILAIQQRKGELSFYVHYEDYNKRLDEWIPASHLDLSQPVEWPQVDTKDKKKAMSKSQKRKKQAREQSQTPEVLTPGASGNNSQGMAIDPSKLVRKDLNESLDETMTIASSDLQPNSQDGADQDVEMMDLVATASSSNNAGPVREQPYTHTVDGEKLRTGGSLIQNQTETSRVRNLSRVQMGRYEMEPWYFSPYPSQFADAEMVYICEFCLSYFASLTPFRRHRKKCTLRHPPGNEIYRDDYISMFEVDGRRQRTWARNLCLLSKLFLDHKTLYWDVDPFLFYCMCTCDGYGFHLVGYFSKEKESAEGFNVACILTLPQFQRRGYGRLLIEFSYELSRRENKVGSPEKPLSDLGLLGYRAYWQEAIVDVLLDREQGKGEVTVEDLSQVTCMTQQDVIHTLQNLNMIRFSKDQHVIVLPDAIVKQREKQREKEKLNERHRIDPTKLQWKPPVFTASTRTWNW